MRRPRATRRWRRSPSATRQARSAPRRDASAGVTSAISASLTSRRLVARSGGGGLLCRCGLRLLVLAGFEHATRIDLRDRVLHLAHAGPETSRDLRHALRAEQQGEHADQDHDLPDPEAEGHRCGCYATTRSARGRHAMRPGLPALGEAPVDRCAAGRLEQRVRLGEVAAVDEATRRCTERGGLRSGRDAASCRRSLPSRARTCPRAGRRCRHVEPRAPRSPGR